MENFFFALASLKKKINEEIDKSSFDFDRRIFFWNCLFSNFYLSWFFMWINCCGKIIHRPTWIHLFHPFIFFVPLGIFLLDLSYFHFSHTANTLEFSSFFRVTVNYKNTFSNLVRCQVRQRFNCNFTVDPRLFSLLAFCARSSGAYTGEISSLDDVRRQTKIFKEANTPSRHRSLTPFSSSSRFSAPFSDPRLHFHSPDNSHSLTPPLFASLHFGTYLIRNMSISIQHFTLFFIS